MKYVILISALIFALTASVSINNVSKSKVKYDVQDLSYNFNPKIVKLLALNYKKMLASIIWTKTLLDADIEHYKKRDLGSWIYRKLLMIIELHPKFYEPYRYGGLYLAVVKDDIMGAKNIYEKGLLVFPKDHSLNYYYGMLLHVDFKNSIESLPFLKLALSTATFSPKKNFLANVIGGILAKKTQNHFIITYLEALKNDFKDPALIEKIEKRIEHIKNRN